MGCCSSSMKIKELSGARPELDGSIYLARGNGGSGSGKRLYSSRNSSGMGSSSSNSSCNSSTTRSSNRSIWSRSRAICDDFSEQPQQQQQQQAIGSELERSCGYYTCSSSASTPTKQQQHQLMRTQDMGNSSTGSTGSMGSTESNASTDSIESTPMVSNLEWEMYMMQQAQRIMPKTSSPISQRRGAAGADSYNKWRNYLQGTPAHMLHNVTHIPEAIAGHFCPTNFPAFSDLEDMESAAKRYKVDKVEEQRQQEQMAMEQEEEQLYTTSQLLAGHTHTITTDL